MNINDQYRDADEELVINLAELFYLFCDKFKMLLLMAVIGAVAVGAFTFFLIAPKYEATAQLYVVSASSDSVVNLSDLQIGTSLTADYKQLVLSRPMMESVIKNLSLQDVTVEQLRKMLEVNNPSGTRILEITATSTDPVQSRDIANEVAVLAVKWLPSVMESNEPNIAEEAIVPTVKSSPSYPLNALLGAVVLAVLYFAVCVVKYLYNDTITSSEQMERYFGAMPLAAIPEDKALFVARESPRSPRRWALASAKKPGRRAATSGAGGSRRK